MIFKRKPKNLRRENVQKLHDILECLELQSACSFIRIAYVDVCDIIMSEKEKLTKHEKERYNRYLEEKKYIEEVVERLKLKE